MEEHGVRYELTEHPPVFNTEQMNAVDLFVRDDKSRTMI